MAHITHRVPSILQDGYVQARILRYIADGIIAFPVYQYSYISFDSVVWC